MAVNLRQQEQSLVVTGHPVTIANIPAGHRLLLVIDNQYFTHHAGVIYCNAIPVTTITGTVVGMHQVGKGIVIVTTTATIHLAHDATGWHKITISDAVPRITIVATDEFTTQQALDAYTFASPLDRWTAPLASADVAALTSRYRIAHNAALAAVNVAGGYSAPLMVCYGVRMWDDNYLWISNPVTVGMSTMENAALVTATVTTDSNRYTGTGSALLTMQGYHLGIKVDSGVGQQWLPLVKSIDVFATVQPAIVDNSSLYYRCLTTQGGSRIATLQYGWQQLSQNRVDAALATSGWVLVASTTSIDALSSGRFEAANVVRQSYTGIDVVNSSLQSTVSLTREQVNEINRGTTAIEPVASIVRNGRLYLASHDGMLSTSAHGNAMSTTQVARVTGAQVRAIAPVLRPIYSGGFGRYAVYLFTTEGIYAVAQSAHGMLGEARLVDRSVIAPACVPVDGDCDIYYIDRHQWLCNLKGCKVTRLVPVPQGVAGMAWDDAHCELHLLKNDGTMLAVTPNGDYSQRTVAVTALYDDVTHAVGVTSAGEVLDLCHEDDCEQVVEYLSLPIEVNGIPNTVLWCVWSDSMVASMQLLGDRGRSCHGFLVGALRVNGVVNAPLPMRVVAPFCRTVRLMVKGSALTGTVISPTQLGIKSCK